MDLRCASTDRVRPERPAIGFDESLVVEASPAGPAGTLHAYELTHERTL